MRNFIHAVRGEYDPIVTFLARIQVGVMTLTFGAVILCLAH